MTSLTPHLAARLARTFSTLEICSATFALAALVAAIGIERGAFSLGLSSVSAALLALYCAGLYLIGRTGSRALRERLAS